MELTEHITKLLAGDDPVASVTQFCRTEIDAAYQENITSFSAATSTASSRRSRKRARELAWCDVLEGTGILRPATEYNTPHHFVDMNQSQQESFLTRMGLESREQDLLKTKLH
jgi:hypothetical protein